jgi:hypothetical protein
MFDVLCCAIAAKLVGSYVHKSSGTNQIKKLGESWLLELFNKKEEPPDLRKQ